MNESATRYLSRTGDEERCFGTRGGGTGRVGGVHAHFELPERHVHLLRLADVVKVYQVWRILATGEICRTKF
jgi:hypothetical protein